MQPIAHIDTVPFFSLSSPKGGEGWGEEAIVFLFCIYSL